MATTKEPSKPIPVLLAVLVCDVAVADPSTGKKNLIGIFDKVFVSRFPSARPMSVYFKLSDAIGHYQLLIQCIDSTTGETLGEASGELTAANPLDAADAHVPFPGVPLPRAGRYEFRILADSVYLGSAVIDAVLREAAPQGEKDKQ